VLPAGVESDPQEFEHPPQIHDLVGFCDGDSPGYSVIMR